MKLLPEYTQTNPLEFWSDNKYSHDKYITGIDPIGKGNNIYMGFLLRNRNGSITYAYPKNRQPSQTAYLQHMKEFLKYFIIKPKA